MIFDGWFLSMDKENLGATLEGVREAFRIKRVEGDVAELPFVPSAHHDRSRKSDLQRSNEEAAVASRLALDRALPLRARTWAKAMLGEAAVVDPTSLADGQAVAALSSRLTHVAGGSRGSAKAADAAAIFSCVQKLTSAKSALRNRRGSREFRVRRRNWELLRRAFVALGLGFLLTEGDVVAVLACDEVQCAALAAGVVVRLFEYDQSMSAEVRDSLGGGGRSARGAPTGDAAAAAAAATARAFVGSEAHAARLAGTLQAPAPPNPRSALSPPAPPPPLPATAETLPPGHLAMSAKTATPAAPVSRAADTEASIAAITPPRAMAPRAARRVTPPPFEVPACSTPPRQQQLSPARESEWSGVAKARWDQLRQSLPRAARAAKAASAAASGGPGGGGASASMVGLREAVLPLPPGKTFHFFVSHKKWHSTLSSSSEALAVLLKSVLEERGFTGCLDLDDIREITAAGFDTKVICQVWVWL